MNEKHKDSDVPELEAILKKAKPNRSNDGVIPVELFQNSQFAKEILLNPLVVSTKDGKRKNA